MGLFDRFLLTQVERAEQQAARAETGVTRSQADIDVLRFSLERLSLITEALWMILKAKHGYSDEDLVERIAEIDLRDGKQDGHTASGEAPTCPQCKRMHVAKHRPICLYCGATMPRPDPFIR